MKYYTYILIDSRTSEPFYVGKGIGDRMYNHEMLTLENKIPNSVNYSLYIRILEIVLSGRNIEYKKVLDCVSNKEACHKEIELISIYGRQDLGTGILCNMTDGGEGTSNFIRDDIYRENVRQSRLGKKQSKESKEKNRQRHLGKKQSKESNDKRSKTLQGHITTKETGLKISIANQGKSNYNIWLLKYGKEEADKRKFDADLKLELARLKIPKDKKSNYEYQIEKYGREEADKLKHASSNRISDTMIRVRANNKDKYSGHKQSKESNFKRSETLKETLRLKRLQKQQESATIK